MRNEPWATRCINILHKNNLQLVMAVAARFQEEGEECEYVTFPDDSL